MRPDNNSDPQAARVQLHVNISLMTNFSQKEAAIDSSSGENQEVFLKFKSKRLRCVDWVT